MALDTYEKQPFDDKDYDIIYTDWLPQGDELATASVASVECTSGGETVPTLEAYQCDVSSTTVKVWVRGGLDGERYKVTIHITTTNVPSRKDESELNFVVKNT